MSIPFSPVETNLSAPIDLYRVRQLFANPDRVRESAFLRREISTRMHERLKLVKLAPQCVLDAGCGDGSDLSVLQQLFADARILALDASFEMLAAASQQRVATQPSINRLMQKWFFKHDIPVSGLICGDFAQLPLAQNSVDLIWSNLAIHWHPQPDHVFAEWRRVLRTDGLLMFSCFGPDTMKELRNAFAQINSDTAVLPFVDMHDFGDMLVNVGFTTPVMDMETITVTYNTVEKLFADVRAWGGNPLSTRSRGLIGQNAWHLLEQALERMRRSDGKLPLTFEIIYGHAFRPAPKRTIGGDAIVHWDLGKKKLL